MKKVLVSLLLTAGQVFAEDELQEVKSEVTNLKDKVMAHWYGLSETHKMIIYGVIALGVIWVVYRMLNCGCCGGDCKCHK